MQARAPTPATAASASPPSTSAADLGLHEAAPSTGVQPDAPGVETASNGPGPAAAATVGAATTTPAPVTQSNLTPASGAQTSARPATARPVAIASASSAGAPRASASPTNATAAAAALADENGDGADASFSGPGHPAASNPGLDPDSVDPATPVAGPVGTDEAAIGLSAGQQVTAALSSLAGASGSAGDTTVGDAGSLDVSATPGAAPAGKVTATADGGREIVVKLDPEHLGSVQIRLKMNGDKVDVSITVDNPSTLNLLNQDRHLLTSAVSSLGLGSGPLLLSPGGFDGSSQSSGPAGGGSDVNGSSSHDSEAFSSGDPAGAGQNRRGKDRAAASDAVEKPEADAPASISQARTEGLYV